MAERVHSYIDPQEPASEILSNPQIIFDKFQEIKDKKIKYPAFDKWLTDEWAHIGREASIRRYQASFEDIDPHFKETRGPKFVDMRAQFDVNVVTSVILLGKGEGDHSIRIEMNANREDLKSFGSLHASDEYYPSVPEELSHGGSFSMHRSSSELFINKMRGFIVADFKSQASARELL